MTKARIMQRLSRVEILITAAVAAGLVAATLVGLPQALGAHPWWAQQTGIGGSLGGAAVYLGLRAAGISPTTLLGIAVPLVLLSGLSAHFGRQIFAASFAENTLAGRFWFFGWIAVCGSVALLLPAVSKSLLRR